MKPTLATPVLATSKPATRYQRVFSPQFMANLHPPPPPLDDGVSSSRLSFASLALSWPKWKLVALFFCVLAISSSMPLIYMRHVVSYKSKGDADREAGRTLSAVVAILSVCCFNPFL